MNHLRMHKFKFNTGVPNNDDAEYNSSSNNNNNNNNSNNQSSGSKGLLTRIKRYSTLSTKLSRRHFVGSQKNNSQSPPKLTSGSYNMTGANSEDHRLEIGAPVLISTTTLDADRFCVTEDRLKQIGGGIAANRNIIRNTETDSASPYIPSSSSENEVFVDALSTPTEAENVTFMNTLSQVGNVEAVEKPTAAADDDDDEQVEEQFMSPCDTPAHANMHVAVGSGSGSGSGSVLSDLNENICETQTRYSRNLEQSKSAQNLHRAELKVTLHKSPSMDLNVTAPAILNVPELPELFGQSEVSLADTTDYKDDKENRIPQSYANLTPEPTSSVVTTPTTTTNQSKSEPNTPVIKVEQKVCGYLTQPEHFKSIDSFQLTAELCKKRNYERHCYSKRYSTLYNSNISMNSEQQPQPQLRQQLGSKRSLASCNSQLSHQTNGSAIEDFDLKSVSYQSLNAQNLFVSIDELNEITRQINESEDFNREIDLEYCQHRDNLRPNERRITLLKNKNSRLMSFNQNKEKLKKGWNGMKHWIGEESTRLKEVVQKQTPLKHLSSSKLNLNQSPSERRTLSPLRIELPEQTQAERSMNGDNEFCVDCQHENNTECDDATDLSRDDLDSSLTAQQASDEDLSFGGKRFKDEGQNGFEELRRYVKQGGDFSKELILILQERIDSELIYSKSLSKMANKLNKACRELPGSVAEAWRGVATEMESRSDIHRQLAASFTDEIIKPLKTIVDSHHKARKSVESNVDKASRVLNEWRLSEAKAKKVSHTAARENEKLQDAMLDVRIQKSPSIALLHQGPNKMAAEKEIKSAEKDCVKLDNKRKKAEEAVKRADVEYYTLCVRAERARVDWEMAVLRGSSQLQSSENQRLINMKNFVAQYGRLTADMNPILNGLVQGLQPQIDACNVAKDMQVVKNIRRNSEGPSEQLLPDFYCEHTTLAMNRERRKHALIKLLQLVKTDLERERRSRDGLRGLSQSLNSQEHQNITDKLYHIRSMLTYLEGARLKLHSALLELDHKPRTTHPLAQHIQITRDRTGLQQSILKVPNWLKNDKLNASNREDSVIAESIETINNDSDALNTKDVAHAKQFSRSKSNIETSNSKIITVNGNATSVGVTNVSNNKSKALPTSLNEHYSDRGQADGGSNQQDSDFDEFSSQEDDDDDDLTTPTTHKTKEEQQQHFYQNAQEVHNVKISSISSPGGVAEDNKSGHDSVTGGGTIVLGRCKALYSYTPKLYDELELNPGDIIEVHAKQDDGWWLGALRNQIGIFPATYVEEFA